MEWRASRQTTGNPGSDDSTSYTQWATNFPGIGGPESDFDRDGMTNLMEFSLNSLPNLSSTGDLPQASLAGTAFRFTVTYAPWNSGQTRHVEFSDALAPWSESGILIERITLPDGRFTDTWQSYQPIAPGTPRQFARLRVSIP
jgi:hypothetical protein